MKKYATYKNLKRNDIISNGESFGTISMSAFNTVLINWEGVNPSPLPPISYTKDVWNFQFGSNYEILEESK